MNIHEYQAKQLLATYGVATPQGRAAMSVDEAVKGAEELGGPIWVVKSQIHAGGRGAGRFSNDPNGAGGVRVVKSIDEVRDNATKMLGSTLVTKQTGPSRQRGQAPLYRRGLRHRARALSGHVVGPPIVADCDDGFDRRWHGHRGSRGAHA